MIQLLSIERQAGFNNIEALSVNIITIAWAEYIIMEEKSKKYQIFLNFDQPIDSRQYYSKLDYEEGSIIAEFIIYTYDRLPKEPELA